MVPGYLFSRQNLPHIRLNFSQARDPNLTLNLPLPLIPSQPLSWSDASPLLQTLTSTFTEISKKFLTCRWQLTFPYMARWASL